MFVVAAGFSVWAVAGVWAVVGMCIVPDSFGLRPVVGMCIAAMAMMMKSRLAHALSPSIIENMPDVGLGDSHGLCDQLILALPPRGF